MCKKLLVFSLAFCLGLVLSPSYKQNESTNSENPNLPIIQSEEKVSLQDSTLEYVPNSNAKDRSEGYWISAFNSKEECESFFLKFQKALAENDKKTIASMINFPVYAYLGKSRKIKLINKKDFFQKYDNIFYPQYKKEVLSFTTRDLWATWVGVTVDSGDVWIRKLCEVKNPDNCETKITTFNNYNDSN